VFWCVDGWVVGWLDEVVGGCVSVWVDRCME
jgi:hypothetical protein